MFKATKVIDKHQLRDSYLQSKKDAIELTFSLSWNEEVVKVCDYLSCIQVGLLQNRPGRYMENIWKMLQKRPGRGEKCQETNKSLL